MSMTELNHMAKDLGVENFGTMRKHEVIFHILQKNAERSGVLFPRAWLEVPARGLWLPALAEFQLSAVPRGYLRLAFPDTPV